MKKSRNPKRAIIVYNGKGIFGYGNHEWLIIDTRDDRQVGNVYSTKKDAIKDARLSGYTIDY